MLTQEMIFCNSGTHSLLHQLFDLNYFLRYSNSKTLTLEYFWWYYGLCCERVAKQKKKMHATEFIFYTYHLSCRPGNIPILYPLKTLESFSGIF